VANYLKLRSKELVQDQLTRHACDVMVARPAQTAESILQTMLQITSQGDGFTSCWKNIEATFTSLKDIPEAEDCVSGLLNLICGHFGTIREQEDLYQSSVWVPLLVPISSIIGTVLTISKGSFLTPEEIAEQVELVFSAVEPFLQPRKTPTEVVWPTRDETKLFWTVLINRIGELNKIDPGSTQRHFCLNLIGLISYEAMPDEYLANVLETLDQIPFTDLVPTSELVDHVTEMMNIGRVELNSLPYTLMKSDLRTFFSNSNLAEKSNCTQIGFLLTSFRRIFTNFGQNFFRKNVQI